MSNSLYSVEQEFTSKLSIPFSNFQEVDTYRNLVTVRFRLSTEDRNLSSYWSPNYSIDGDFLYEKGASQIAGKINIEKSGSGSVDITWDEVLVYKANLENFVGAIEQYDVWIRWAGSSFSNPSEWFYKERINTTSNNILIPEYYPYPVVSNATGGNAFTINTSLTIPINLQGQKIIIVGGKGAGYEYEIDSNTIGANSVITITSAFQHEGVTSSPDNTTEFKINNYQQPKEFFIEIYRPGNPILRYENSFTVDQKAGAETTKDFAKIDFATIVFLNSHGYITGTPVVYNSDDPVSLLTNGETYYVRANTSKEISLYPTKSDAENNTNRIEFSSHFDQDPSFGTVTGKRLLVYEGSLTTI